MTIVKVDDSDPTISYTGSWTVGGSSADFDGYVGFSLYIGLSRNDYYDRTSHVANSVGSSFQYVFSGTVVIRPHSYTAYLLSP